MSENLPISNLNELKELTTALGNKIEEINTLAEELEKIKAELLATTTTASTAAATLAATAVSAAAKVAATAVIAAATITKTATDVATAMEDKEKVKK